MKLGSIVEYIDRQKIVCAVVLDVKKQKLRVINEANREVTLSEKRLSHQCDVCLDLSIGRDKLIRSLKETVNRRNALVNQIDVKQLWEILETEQEWIDLGTMTELCFPGKPIGDHQAAVVRAFFKDKLYFKFSQNRFFPNSREKVKLTAKQAKEAEIRNRTIETSAGWLKTALNREQGVKIEDNSEVVEILKSFYLFGKESPTCALAKSIIDKAGLCGGEPLFQFLVKIGAWNKNENIDLLKEKVPVDFPDEVLDAAKNLINRKAYSGRRVSAETHRKDLTNLPLITIDGQSTLDFDDALSIEQNGDHYILGVHISDVGHFVEKGDMVDQEANRRVSSIYMPDQKVTMLPPSLADDLCSLKLGKVRPAISMTARVNRLAEIIDVEFFPSIISIKHQLNYQEANLMVNENKDIAALHDIAQKFRKKRLSQRAVQITLPEINIWINEEGKPELNKTDRESPGRMLVSELMIMANWLTAQFLAKQNVSAIYRGQPEPRERLYNGDDGSLFQNWMQRKFLSRFILSAEPNPHSGLGLDAYVTATSPIRKYFDLVTQRQLRAIFGFEEPYSKEDIEHIIQMLGQLMININHIQNRRSRYWLLKYLEKRIGQKEEAIVLHRRRNGYMVLLGEYMIECQLPAQPSVILKPQDLVQVTIQHASARNDAISIFMS
ncbi:MAG: ribonuclease catalytic domain-containing protein [Desulfobacterales bacterium]